MLLLFASISSVHVQAHTQHLKSQTNFGADPSESVFALFRFRNIKQKEKKKELNSIRTVDPVHFHSSKLKKEKRKKSAPKKLVLSYNVK